MIRKIMAGFLIQDFDEEGVFIGQSFCEGDNIEYEDEDGNVIDEYDIPNLEHREVGY